MVGNVAQSITIGYHLIILDLISLYYLLKCYTVSIVSCGTKCMFLERYFVKEVYVDQGWLESKQPQVELLSIWVQLSVHTGLVGEVGATFLFSQSKHTITVTRDNICNYLEDTCTSDVVNM